MTAFDMTESIAPKSDQINAEDMLSGPRVVTITEVRRGSTDQPVEVVTAEFGPGRPFRPSKTVRRVMVAAWGPDASTYAGKRMTLWNDPSVRWAGQAVGGLRVSHMSDIKKPLTLALTVTRGKRETTTVQPLPDAPAPSQRPSNAITADQLKQLTEAMKANGFTDKDSWLAYLSQTVGQDVAATKELDKDQAAMVLHELNNAPAGDES